MRVPYEPDPAHPLTTAFPYFPPDEQDLLGAELREILQNRLSMGPRVAKFEQEFAAYCTQPYGVAFPSCTAAMEAALIAFGVGPGDDVLVPVQTFIATGMVVSLVGARPVFTEISADTFSMDFDDAWSRVTERTRGAIVVHFGGLIAPAFPAFVERMRASGRFVLEDVAHAPGSVIGGQIAGSFGDAGCFSFYSTKVITTGEGGMLVTARAEVADLARSLQHRGRDMNDPDELYLRPGRNNRFTEIAAAMGLSQLRCLPDFLATRRLIAATYDRCLAENDLVTILPGQIGSQSSFWRYVVFPSAHLDRRDLAGRMARDRISIDWAYDPPLHLQPVFQRLLNTRTGMLPRSEALLSRHICLPVHARMREQDASYVAERLLQHVAALSTSARHAT
jgi:perosamine synthetase